MEVGSVINDQYTVVEHIGRGGMADVWSARDQRLRRMVAIKTIAVGLTQDVDPVALFRQEAQTIASMEHPHILPIYDFGEHGGSLYIVMRFVTGGSLESLVETPMPPSEALRIGEAIASALDHAHANKIIHLDLKPPNILMDSGGAPYLADFGLATVLDPEGRARNPGSGTLLYMAPEQLTAEVIDHRADIYSFSIMMYHMLTGKLPFDGTMPLALRQIQFNDELPAVEERVNSIPSGITDVLRNGTAKEPSQRPSTLMAIVEAMRGILQPGSGRTSEYYVADTNELMIADAVNMQTERLLSLGDPDLLEAVDIYTRARYNWAGGQGRFLVSLTHFLIMSNYYQDARHYDLPIDQFGYQMLLRGALEFDHELDYWWSTNSDDDRRWVCLHTVRSGSTPARIRAFFRLETLPDDPSNPVIPKLVTQALEVEVDTEARLAALAVLATRAKLMKASSRYQIKTEFVGRLLTTMTRLGIEVAAPSVWTDGVYSPEIDIMIAEQALDMSTPRVAEYAARTVGRIHSLTGVRHLANEQRSKRPGALQALAFVRDEAPSLPDIVSPQARAYAWITNTLRRVFDRPLDLILRFVLALLGGWIAFGNHIYSTYYAISLFTPTRWGNTIATGLTAAVFIAVLVIVTDELSNRLRGFWSWWLRLLVCSVLGTLMGVLTWAGFRWFYYAKIPSWDLMVLGGIAFALGFVLVSLVNWKRWKALFLPALLIYLPILISFPNECLQDYYCGTVFGDLWLPAYNYFPVAGVGLAIGVLIGWFIPRRTSNEPLINLPPLSKIMLAGGIGALWCAIIWISYIAIYQQDYLNYYHISLWFYGSLFFGLILATFMQTVQRLAFTGVALVAFTLLGLISTQAIFGTIGAIGADYTDPTYFVAPQKELGVNGDRDSLLTYLTPEQLITVGLPMVFVIALGAYVQSTFSIITSFIGKPLRPHKGRDPWLNGVMFYTLFITGMISVFALFSIHVGIAYGISWSLWGFLAFVCSLALWRWARWGLNGMMALSALLVIGAALYDWYTMTAYAEQGVFPPLLQTQNVILWGIWSIFVGIFAYGAFRRQLWGGIGLVATVLGWYIVTIFGFLPTFGTIQAIANIALFFYAVSPYVTELENGRWRLKVVREPRKSSKQTTRIPNSTLPVAMGAARGMALTAEEEDRLASEGASVYSMNTQLDSPQPKLTFDHSLLVNETPAIDTSALAPSMQTTLDVAPKKPAAPKLKFDTSAISGAPSMETKIDAVPQKPEAPKLKFDMSALTGTPSMETKMDVVPSKPEAPKLKFDTSALTDAPSMETKLDAMSQKPDAPKLKFDTSAISAPPDPTPVKPEAPKLRFDLSALSGSPEETKVYVNPDMPETPPVKLDSDEASDSPGKDTKLYTKLDAPDAPQLKFDTRAVKPKEEEPTQGKRPGLKFDTSALSKQPPPTQLKPSLNLPKQEDEDGEDTTEE